MAGNAPLRHLLRLSRLVTEPSGRSQILPLVAQIAMTETALGAALVVTIEGDRARVVAASGWEAAIGLEFDADEVGTELEQAILQSCHQRARPFTQACSTMLISDGALFGSIVVLSESKDAVSD